VRTSANKYSTIPTFQSNSLIPKNLPDSAKKLVNASITKSSWNKHLAARKSFEAFETFSGKKFDWPLHETYICDYIAWALFKNDLKVSTIKSYISSLTFLHKLNNLDPKGCSSFLVSTALQGAVNLEFYNDRTKPSRKVMTLPLLKLLGHQIAKSKFSRHDKQVIWSACLLAFFGSFRFSELLPPSASSFNAFETLLWNDVIFKDDSVIIRVKIPKSRCSQGEVIDLFEIENSNVCPVSALRNLQSRQGTNPNPAMPIFTMEDGSFLSLSILNSYLYDFFHPLIGEEANLISGHSFRAALPSALANSPDIANDSDIRSWGRWNSSAFKRYTRLKPRQKRVIFSKILASLKNL
jgi:hypothetical protein